MSLPTAQQILRLLQETAPQQYTMKRLIQHFAVPVDERPAFRDTVRALVAQGHLTMPHGTRYALPQRSDTHTGVVKRHADGYGFVMFDDVSGDDVYLSRHAMRGVMHGDRVLVRLESPQGRDERRSGRVLQVLERAQHEVIGRIETAGRLCWLLPQDARLCPDIFLPPAQPLPARRGAMAVVAITRYTLTQEHPYGRIVEILGSADAPDMEMRLILRKYALQAAFPPEVEAAAEAMPAQVEATDILGRRDLRDLLTVTIDGATARDFDDAVSLEVLAHDRVRLGVHIADVSYYVHEDSPMDHEAAQRGTSVYFPDRVIPMLPGRLSHDICCLQPDVDRLTLSVFIELTADGRPVHYEMAETVIHSRARLTYAQVAAYLDGETAALAPWPLVIGPMLHRLDALAAVLRAQRVAAGSLDFDLPEVELVLDSRGKIDTIVRAERTRAHILIEEGMLLANRTVATHLVRLGVPMLYRVHEAPGAEALAPLQTCLRTFGYDLTDTAPLQPGSLQTLLVTVAGQPEAPLLHHLLLRSLPRAHYAAALQGHFGLCYPAYTHFTSPIRRYPDLIVHRILRDTMAPGGMTAARRIRWQALLPDLAAATSMRERQADDAEREVEHLKKVEFMLDKVGEEFDGVITRVTAFGLFVELEHLFVEGLVHINWLSEAYTFDPERLCLVGQHTGHRYALGDRVHIRVDKVSLADKHIDFALLTT
jgi:ribonuclease R